MVWLFPVVLLYMLQALISLKIDEVISLVQRVLDHAPDGKEVSERLLSLKQGNRRATDYVLDFRTLAAESRWNDSVIRAVYCQGLNDDINKELVCRDESDSLGTLIHMSIKLDNILRERISMSPRSFNLFKSPIAKWTFPLAPFHSMQNPWK